MRSYKQTWFGQARANGVCACFFILCSYPAGLFADTSLGRKITFTSTPAGATVCKKVLDRQECYGHTPLAIEVDLESGSKKFIVKKLGYRSQELYVDAKTDKVAAKLEKRDLFFDPDKHKDKNLADIQRGVNEQMARIVYSSGLGSEPNFELIGQATVYKTERGVHLGLPVLINSYETLRKLKQAGRNRGQTRYANTMKVFNDSGVFPLFDEVIKSVSTLGLDNVVFTVAYSRSNAVLDFEQVEQIHRRYVSSYYTSTHRIDTYEVYTTKQDVTVVKDERVPVDYAFTVGMNLVRSGGRAKLIDLLDKIEVVTNDNPKNKYEKLENLTAAQQ